MTHKLAEQARAAVPNKSFTSTPGMCQRFVRQCIQAVYGDKYDAFHASSAFLAAKRWNKTGNSQLPSVKLQPGDILYWAATPSNPFGHTAIVIDDEHIAENSTVHRKSKFAYKGTRLIRELRAWQVVVRLPA